MFGLLAALCGRTGNGRGNTTQRKRKGEQKEEYAMKCFLEGERGKKKRSTGTGKRQGGALNEMLTARTAMRQAWKWQEDDDAEEGEREQKEEYEMKCLLEGNEGKGKEIAEDENGKATRRCAE